jgi:hypothetical protein
MIELQLKTGCKTLVSENLIERIEEVPDFSTSGSGEKQPYCFVYFLMRPDPIIVAESLSEIQKKLEKKKYITF